MDGPLALAHTYNYLQSNRPRCVEGWLQAINRGLRDWFWSHDATLKSILFGGQGDDGMRKESSTREPLRAIEDDDTSTLSRGMETYWTSKPPNILKIPRTPNHTIEYTTHYTAYTLASTESHPMHDPSHDISNQQVPCISPVKWTWTFIP